MQQKDYIDINNKKIDLSKLSLEELNELNFQEETYFAKEIKKKKPFSSKRNIYLKESYEKIMQIAEFKRKFTKKAGNGVNDYTIALVKKIIKKIKRKNKDIIFYEGGVGTGYLLKSILDENINIKGCDVFLSKETKKLREKHNNVSLIEENLYNALDEIPDNSIDIFYADNVLEHIVDDEYEKTCERIVSKIKKKGIAILIIPNSYVGPSDITHTKFPTGSKSLGFHFMEQTFKAVVDSFNQYNMICSYFCCRKKNDEILIFPHASILNFIKKEIECNFGKIKDIRRRKRIFKLLGYNIYVLEKK